MPKFGSTFSWLADDRKFTDEELVHARRFLGLLRELAPDGAKLYAEGEKEVEKKIMKGAP